MFDLDNHIAMAESAIADRRFYNAFDRSTYLKYDWYVDFQRHQDLKIIWCHQAGSRWKVNPDQLYQQAPDRCPIFDTPLDYGLGLNMVLREAQGRNNDWFRPSVDHIKPKSLYPDLQHEVTNMVIVSNRANRLKSNIESFKELEQFYQGYQKVYENQPF